MSEGLALFVVSSVGAIVVGIFFNLFMKRYNERQDEVEHPKREK